MLTTFVPDEQALIKVKLRFRDQDPYEMPTYFSTLYPKEQDFSQNTSTLLDVEVVAGADEADFRLGAVGVDSSMTMVPAEKVIRVKGR